MPGAISTPADRGFFQPGEVIQNAVTQYVQDQIRRAQEQRTQEEAAQTLALRAAQEQRTGTQFGTEQAVRSAVAAPQIDPEVIRQKVLAAQLGAKTSAANAGYIGGLPDLARIAMLNGHLPMATSTGTSFDPTSGAQVTQASNGLMDPASGLYTPYGGSRTQGAPPVSTTTTIKPPEPGVSATPGLAVVREEDSIVGPGGKRIVTRTSEKPQRVTPPHGDAALLDMAERLGVDPDDLSEAVQGMINKKSATAPLNPNAPKSGTVESLTAQQSKLQAALEQETDPAAIKDTRQAIQNIQGRIDAMNRQFTQKAAKPGFREALGLTPSPAINPAPNLNGTPSNAPAPGPASGSAQINSQPTGAPISTPNPAPIPKTTPPGPAKPATTNPPAFQKGTIYKDAQGNRAQWDGTKFVEVSAGQ